MLEYSRFEAGERYQRDLFNFVVNVDKTPLNAAATTAERELILLRRSVQERLRIGGYQLQQSKRFSPADLCGMDYVLFSHSLNRMHFIDVTVDPVKKWQLPRLRRDSLFVIDTEDETVTQACKRQFLERLLELMSTQSLLTMKDCWHPTIEGDITPRQTVVELENFRERLESRLQFFQTLSRSRPEQAAEHKLSAELIREYPQVLIQQGVFETWAAAAAPTAVRETCTPGSQNFRTEQSTHQVEFESGRDQIVLFVQGKRYKLTNITSVIATVTERVWETKKYRPDRPDQFQRKNYTKSGLGLIKSVENLARLISVTPLSILLGDTFPVSAPQVFKPGSKRFGQRKAG
jgi:hypothetical protein